MLPTYFDNFFDLLVGNAGNFFRLSPDDSSLLVTFAVPLMNFTANYDIKGRILVLPIEGTGPLEILSRMSIVKNQSAKLK